MGLNLSGDELAQAYYDEFDPLQNAVELIKEIALLRTLHPDWSDTRLVIRAQLNVSSGRIHILLDVLGLIPGVGIVPDFINGGFYLLEGDGKNAALSYTAMLPLAGWAPIGAKYGMKIVDGRVLSLTTENGRVLFTGARQGVENRSLLRGALNTPVGEVAHLIAPWAFRGEPLIQQAARSGKFHMNGAKNGESLLKEVHQRGHKAYDNFKEWMDNQVVGSPEQAYTLLMSKINKVRSQLKAGIELADIIFSVYPQSCQ